MLRRAALLLLSSVLSACTADTGPARASDASTGGTAPQGARGAGTPPIQEPATTGVVSPHSAGGSNARGSGGASSDADAAGSTSAGKGGATSAGGVAGASGAPSSGGASLPAACAAAVAAGADAGRDAFVANTGKQAATSVTYTNVGASGAYAEVVTGWSKATGCVSDGDGSLCKATYRTPKQVSGNLAPFDEEMAMVFAGPVELYQIAVYGPAAGGWDRAAYWDPCKTEGLAFAGNKSWYECGGFVESYVSADGTAKSDSPVQFAGHLAAGTEVNVVSSTLCTGKTAGSDCGWSSGLALHGFAGDAAGSKLFATKFRMPFGTKTPAYWILPAQVIRSSQYGCNCRGQGSDPTYKGGCGELDVAEILGGVTTSREATTTLYSFQDITGGGSVAFNRPVNDAAVFLVIFDAPGRRIGIRRLEPSQFDFASSLSSSEVDRLLADAGTVRALK